MNQFSLYKSIHPVNVRLPNGSCVLASHSSTIHFSDDLILIDVLYIPEFTFNLIFITKLTHSLACQIIFSHNTCIIQERHSLKTIGSAEVRDGLYMLSSSCKVYVTCSSVNNMVVTTNNAWHFRLGHLLDQKLGILRKQYPYISHLNKKACDICPLAKQKRLPFTDSISHSVHPSNIVHMDIWGPISSPSIHGHRYFLTVVDDFS